MTRRIIYSYVSRELLLSFLVAFLFFFVVFFVNQLLLLAEDILEKRVPLWDVVMLLIYSLPSIVALAVPFGTLVGGLMAVGRLSSDNEIIAFQGSGIALRVLFLPILFWGAVLSLFSFVTNDYLLPIGNMNLVTRYRELIMSNPDLEFESHSVQEYQDLVLVTGDVSDRVIEELLIIETGRRGRERVISAGRAELFEDAERPGVFSLRLSDVESHDPVSGDEEDHDFFTSEEMTYNILLSDIALSVRNPTAREMSSVDVWEMIEEQRKSLDRRKASHREDIRKLERRYIGEYIEASGAVWGDGYELATAELAETFAELRTEQERNITSRSLQINLIEFHKKFSIPFACLTFVVLAFPIGLRTRRSGRAVGFIVGLGVSTFYWGLIFAGQTVGTEHQNVPAFLAMWFPNILVVAIGVTSYALKRAR